MIEEFTSDDPRLTAYVLDELEGSTKDALETALSVREDLRETVQEIERVVGLIHKSKAAQRNPPARVHSIRLMPGLKDTRHLPPSKLFHWALWGPMAAVTATALIFILWRPMLIEFNDTPASASFATQPQATVSYGLSSLPKTDNADNMVDRPTNLPYIDPREMPESFPRLQTGKASYMMVRETLEDGGLPLPDSVRIEEMINYFPYNYPEPPEDLPFSLTAETGCAPWNPKNRLLRVGIKATGVLKGHMAEAGADPAVAKDVQLQIAFNPVNVQFYRLLGYQVREPGTDDAEREDLAAGNVFTALYEWAPDPGEQPPSPVGESLPLTESAPKLDGSIIITMHYKNNGEDRERIYERPVYDSGLQEEFIRSPPDFKFVAAVAGFAMILRGDPYLGDFGLDACRKLAIEGLNPDPDGKRHEFVELIDKAESLLNK